MWLIFRDLVGLTLATIALLHLARIADALARIANALSTEECDSALRGFTDGRKWKAAQQAKQRT